MAELFCELRAPCTWSPEGGDLLTRQSMMRETVLILNAVNHMEGLRELEAGGAENRRLDRIEAKLDLALYLLARGLPGSAAPVCSLRLEPERLDWDCAAPPAAGQAVVVEWVAADSLPLTLRLPATALEPMPGRARVRLSGLPPELEDALYQFIFRRHRQAIRARGGVANPILTPALPLKRREPAGLLGARYSGIQSRSSRSRKRRR